MNPHFDPRFDGRGDIPSSVYARVDSVEEDAEGRVVIGLDAVSIRSADLLLSRRSPTEWERAWASSWRRDEPPRDLLEPFDGLELLHLDVSVHPSEARDLLARSDSAPWLQLTLGAREGALPATAYASLFGVGQPASVSLSDPPDRATLALLNAAFSMRDWPVTPFDQWDSGLQPANTSYWHAFDVGQGSANGFGDDHGPISLFHDLGCGVYRNAKTRPPGLILCHSQPHAPIVLSHWDSDHWGGATRFGPPKQPDIFLERMWIVPFDLTLGPTHISFAVSILAAGGKLRVLPPGPWESNWISTSDGRQLRLLRGNGRDRNGSGVALEIEDHVEGRWLLTGDVDYQFLAQHLAPSYVAISVPHHGAGASLQQSIPQPSSNYARLIYSFGGDNSFKHPTAKCIGTHTNRGWHHGTWTGNSCANKTTSQHVRATACNSPGANHLGSIMIGWTSAPTVPVAPRCPSPRCTMHATQA